MIKISVDSRFVLKKIPNYILGWHTHVYTVHQSLQSTIMKLLPTIPRRLQSMVISSQKLDIDLI